MNTALKSKNTKNPKEVNQKESWEEQKTIINELSKKLEEQSNEVQVLSQIIGDKNKQKAK